LDAASLSALGRVSGLGGEQATSAWADLTGGGIIGKGKAGVGSDAMDGAFSMSEIDQKPRPVHQTSPMYPATLRGKKIEGVVTVIFIVDASGKVNSPRVEKSNNPAFEKPALDAVRKWKFEAAVKGGERVACRMRAPIRFPAS
jgi:protein TonB